MDNNYTIEKKEGSEVILKMEIPADALQQSYEQLLSSRSESMDLKGFRKGNVPKDLIEPQLEMLLMTETFEQLAPYYVNAALMKEEIQPVAPPEYRDLEELRKGKPAIFKVKVTIMPDFTLCDIGKIKVEDANIEVTNEEIENTLNTMFGNNEDGDTKKMDDAWAKKVAEEYKFEDVKKLDDLRDKIRELLERQKQNLVDQNKTSEVMKQAVELSKIEVPNAAIAFEAQQREEAFNQDLDRAGVTLDDFLKQRNTKVEDLRDMWLKDAKEALENDVVLKLYADKNDVELTDDEFATEIEKIKQSAKQQYEMEHAGHDHESHFDESVYDDPQWQAQVRGYLMKQKAYQELLKEVLGDQIIQPSDRSAKNKKTEKKQEKVVGEEVKEKSDDEPDRKKK